MSVPPFAPADDSAFAPDAVDDDPPPLPLVELVESDEPHAAANMPAAATTVARKTERFTGPLLLSGPAHDALRPTLPGGSHGCPVDRRSENRRPGQARA